MDPALLRPGRIDRKIQYYLATKEQAKALFIRFYPISYTTLSSERPSDSEDSEKKPVSLSLADKESAIKALASEFALNFPEEEFTTAELQGYLLSCKKEPERAAAEVGQWVENERKEREERKMREAERLAKMKERKEAREADRLQSSLDRLKERRGRQDVSGSPGNETREGAEGSISVSSSESRSSTPSTENDPATLH